LILFVNPALNRMKRDVNAESRIFRGLKHWGIIPMVKCVIYSRVSTEEQSTANQTNILTEWAETRGFTVVEVYQEQEGAWRNGHQRELARLSRDAHKGRFSTILVWSLDRLSREGSLAILQLVNKFSARGVKVLSYQEPWTEAPGEIGELLYALTGWVARMESQRRSERTKAGLARVKAQGKILGRPRDSKDKKRRRRQLFAVL
jgi:DNA invertase Pin-like site-specific DNA recombinase